MKAILSMLGDGTGEVSLMRVITLLVVVSVIASKFYNAWLTKQPIVWDAQDLEMIGGVFTAKLVQNTQEKNNTPKP
jgi:hypothetical protein